MTRRVKMPSQNLFRLLQLLRLVMRIVLATVFCTFGSWCLVVKLNFWLDFEHKVWSRFWSWSSGEILKLKFSQYFAADPWLRLWRLLLVEILKLRLDKILKYKFSRNAHIWFRFWSCCLVKILISDQEFFWELVIWSKEVTLVTLGSFVPLAMFWLSP